MKRVKINTVLVLAGLLSSAGILQAQQLIHLRDGRDVEGVMASFDGKTVNWILAEGEGSAEAAQEVVDNFVNFQNGQGNGR